MSGAAAGRLRAVGPDVAVGLVVAVGGLATVRAPGAPPGTGVRPAVVVLATAAAAALCRRAPGAALAVVWLTCLAQVVLDLPPVPAQLSLALVAHACARWGRTTTVVLSAASIPVGLLLGFALLTSGRYDPVADGALGRLLAPLAGLLEVLRLGPLGLGVLVLAAPWLGGLAVRYQARARASRASQLAAEAREVQAAEVAALRGEQARLAADVHDVVGHSLAVILAQAESGQYLPDDDPARLKQTLAVIATSARSSLQDVRAVLAPAGADGTPYRSASLDDLVEGARRSGQEVLATGSGAPRPLPPELAEVAHRVLQEMLTNALRHGRRDTPVVVDRTWDEELRIQVVNEVAGATTGAAATSAQDGPRGRGPGGRGLPGMHDRLASVGGRLDVDAGPTTFTATAWLPVRR